VEGAVGERRVKIAVTAPEQGPLSATPSSTGGACNRHADREHGLDTGQGRGVEGAVKDGKADDVGNEAKDEPFGWREVEDGSKTEKKSIKSAASTMR